jgi:hypothetical protein
MASMVILLLSMGLCSVIVPLNRGAGDQPICRIGVGFLNLPR